jgi:hypothetical protein
MGVAIFIALILASAYIYFQSERFDDKYKKNIEIIRAVKTQKLLVKIREFKEDESVLPQVEEGKEDFPSIEDFKKLEEWMLKSNKNLNRLMKIAADLKMWFDYLPRAKEFLVSAALWVFLLGLAALAFCLSLWAEMVNIGHIQYSGYLSFLWIFMSIRLFKNILRYNMVTKNISKHMDMLREGEVEKF